jgi:uncharacterized membrane protein YhhN
MARYGFLIEEARGNDMDRTADNSRLVLVVALIAGASYLLPVIMGLSGGVFVAWKGAGVALLALYAALHAKDREGWMIASVLALGALGDVLIEVRLEAAAAAFLVGHIIAIALYRRHMRAALTSSQKALALVVVPLTCVIAWSLTADAMVLFYSLFLSVMAATAWTSSFPRYRVGIGAMMFVASDLLIFARMEALAEAPWIGAAIWGLYFGGQALIAIGVVTALQLKPKK